MMYIGTFKKLSGSIRPEVVWDLLKNSGLVSSLEDVYDQMTYRHKIGPREFYTFLNKFKLIDQIKWSEDNLVKVLRSIVKDIRREGLKYVELRFSIDKYLPYFNNDANAVLQTICNVITNVAKHNKIEIKLFLAIKHESDRALQQSVSKVIDNEKTADLLDGIDIIGDESKFNDAIFIPIYREWKNAGKLLTAHVGETQGPENIRIAIEKLNVHRVGHGISIMKDPYTAAMAVERDICFEISLTSNWVTSIVERMPNHPIRAMYDAGLKIALCTDDPSIFGTTMNQEFTIARMSLGFNDSDIEFMKRCAIDYSAKNLLGK